MKQVSHAGASNFQGTLRPDEKCPNISDSRTNPVFEQAILKTVLYADLFDYPLTPDEVAHYLIGVAGCAQQVQTALEAPVWLSGQVTMADGYIMLVGREGLVTRRRDRVFASNRLWRKARFYTRILSLMPFVRAVAVTGALAMDNSNHEDDIDVLIVTTPTRVWLARALAVLVVYAFKFVPNTLCPNYVIAQNVLSLEPRSIYVAHEFVQMVPLYGNEICKKMRAANPWIEEMLPNAGRPLHSEKEHHVGWLVAGLKGTAEWFLSGRFGDRLETWEMRRKIRKFAPRAANETGCVILDRSQVKGHFDDHGARISSEYQCRLGKFRLTFPEGA